MAKAIDRGLENREIVLGILTEVLDKGNFVHLVLNQALSKYQYLEKPDRAFITRVTVFTGCSVPARYIACRVQCFS